MRISVSLVPAAILSMCLGMPAGHAVETSIACTSLPAALQPSIARESAGATIRGCSREVEKGKASYELQTEKAGRTRDITMDAHGVVLEIEEEVPFAELPPAVSRAITRAAAGAAVGKVESLAKGGAIVSYETTVRRGSRAKEMAFLLDGSRIKPD